MTITDLQIQLDLHFDDKAKVLRDVACDIHKGFFFVDSEDGQCYLFDESGNLDDIAKVKTLKEKYIKKDIKKIIIPNSVTNIEGYTFYNCSDLTNVTIPDSVTHIGDWAFNGCINFISMTIPNNIMRIGHGAFWGCSGLISMTIPNNIMSIGSGAFYTCNNLKSLIFKGKTIRQVKAMKNYPFGIGDESIIRCKS